MFKYELLFQRTPVWFPGPIWSSSQQPVTPDPEGCEISDLCREPTLTCAHSSPLPSTYIHNKIEIEDHQVWWPEWIPGAHIVEGEYWVSQLFSGLHINAMAMSSSNISVCIEREKWDKIQICWCVPGSWCCNLFLRCLPHSPRLHHFNPVSSLGATLQSMCFFHLFVLFCDKSLVM